MGPLRIAVIGSGPAGLYAVQHLLDQTEIEVAIDIFERLPTPWGLIRSGIAPDHHEKKKITDRLFEFYLKRPNVRFLGNVEVGRDISHETLARSYHALIYAVGADDDNALGIAGERLPGSWSARQFVSWYNGHPDFRDLQFDLSGPRAVIVGTGNVALDVARILTIPVEELARTDIADHALEALRNSGLKEVVILGRRGCQQAAFHNAELEELLDLDGVEVRVEADDLIAPGQSGGDWITRRKLATLIRLQTRKADRCRKRIIFKFHRRPVTVLRDEHTPGLDVAVEDGSGGSSIIHCGLVLRAVGYRGRPIDGLPFDPDRHLIPNSSGRVSGDRGTRNGIYVTGWIKRGPKGVLGSNKHCASQTVQCLLADAREGRLSEPVYDEVAKLMAHHRQIVSYEGWRSIDTAERVSGVGQGRPRVKQTRLDELLASASSRAPKTPSSCEATDA